MQNYTPLVHIYPAKQCIFGQQFLTHKLKIPWSFRAIHNRSYCMCIFILIFNCSTQSYWFYFYSIEVKYFQGCGVMGNWQIVIQREAAELLWLSSAGIIEEMERERDWGSVIAQLSGRAPQCIAKTQMSQTQVTPFCHTKNTLHQEYIVWSMVVCVRVSGLLCHSLKQMLKYFSLVKVNHSSCLVWHNEVARVLLIIANYIPARGCWKSRNGSKKIN